MRIGKVRANIKQPLEALGRWGKNNSIICKQQLNKWLMIILPRRQPMLAELRSNENSSK